MAKNAEKKAPPRAVKAEFDESLSATPNAGAVLYEQAMRAIDMRKLLGEHLPARSPDCEYSSADIAYGVIAGLLCQGKGFQCAEGIRKDELLAKIFGLEERVGTDATVYRGLCDMAGLPQRKRDEVYVPAGPRQASIDMFGTERKTPKLRRLVPEEPEAMRSDNKKSMEQLLAAQARRCCEKLPFQALTSGQFVCCHGDATDVEVDGNCFDAAEINHEGKMSLRLQTLRVGSIYCAEQLLPGATDEGRNLPELIKRAHQGVLRHICGSHLILDLLDAAYCEKPVVDTLVGLNHYYLICANQYRDMLTRMAQQLQPTEWAATGPDLSRGWSESQVGVFRHQPEGWSAPQIVIARRWKCVDELALDWHYSFLYTNLDRSVVSKNKLRQYGYVPYLWMLYGSKQGHENYYKARLTDLGGHHPSSGRLGAAQALSALIGLAANICAVMSYKVVPKNDRGIRPWRFVRDYVHVAGCVVMQAGRVLLVKLAGGNQSNQYKSRWLEAFACAQRL